mgnify:CR=1 FL=1
MKAVQIVKPEDLRVIDIEKPVIDEKNNVLVKMTAAGICGSDMGIYHGTNAAATYPRIIGHEMVGRVDQVGSNVKNLKVGDRVIINQVTSCGHCYPCRKGRGNVCDNLAIRGVHIDGGYREFIAVPESDCYVLPDSLSDTDAIMIEPTTIGIQSCTRAQLEKDDMLLIYGSGALGSTILKVARLLCDHIIVADIMDDKLELARQNGAKYTINPLKMADWLALYQSDALAVQTDHLGQLIGFFFTEIGVVNQVVHIWAYESLDDRLVRRARMAQDERWQTFSRKNRELAAVERLESVLMRPTAFSPLQ